MADESTTTPDRDDQDPPGARLAEEFKLLLGVLADRAEPWLTRMATAPEGAEHTPATCGWCPLCAGIAMMRGDRPELAVRAAEHASGLLSVLRASLATPEHQHAEPDPEPDPDTPPTEPGEQRVQKIAIRRSRS